MKDLCLHGVGTSKKQVEPILEEEENRVWELGLLGNLNGNGNGMNVWSVFCITQWGGALEPCSDQIKLFEPPGSPAYLLYTEDASKNNPGGLKHRKIAPNK